jgi:hypothetical protein
MANLTDNNIGELLGQLYVDKHFNKEAKTRMDELVANLVKAYEIRIKNLEWMSDATKQKALDKLHAFTPKIGYPSKWKTYEGLDITPSSFFQNLRNASRWSYQDMVSQLGKPVDKTRFAMTPPTVNAYYNPVNNEIVFPAGILQFPFFHPEADDAFNYGGIGAVARDAAGVREDQALRLQLRKVQPGECKPRRRSLDAARTAQDSSGIAHGFYFGRAHVKVRLDGLGVHEAELLDYPRRPVTSRLISLRMATLHELSTVYSLQDCYDLLDIASVDAHNRRALSQKS